ncbi:MAG: YqeG family HAD IIIA-type phosphatase [Ruminococcaceae bacterium]|nr:YqeG family HAD IIIA-type phosphatase [Oscillospiraceae bacterium]
MFPDYHYNRLEDIPFGLFKQNSIKCILIDVDNTLTGDCSFEIKEEVLKWVEKAKSLGLYLIAISNNSRERVAKFADSIGLEYIFDAKKPLKSRIIENLKNINFDFKEMAVIGDQIFTDILLAKRMGAISILVDPMGKDIPLGVKIKRIFEKPFRKAKRIFQ